MPMVSFHSDGIRFNYRAVGVALRDEWVLLNRVDGQDDWFLPGGRVEMGEVCADALRREMREEIQAEVEVGPLLWVAESFYSEDSRRFHELGLYYAMTFAPDADILRAGGPVTIRDGSTPIIYQWLPLASLDRIILYPPFLVDGLRRLPEHPVHILDTH